MSDPVDRRFVRYQAVLAAATLGMVVLSWPLWVGDDLFPRVPFIPGWPVVGPTLSWVLGVMLVGSLGLVATGRGGRWAAAVNLAVATFLILGDQNRLQPWMQQYLAVGLGLICCGRERALDLARWYVVVLYAASGLSKLDAAFVDELGRTFVTTIGHLVGLAPEGWTPLTRTGAILAMPVGELVVAAALTVARFRPWGLAGSVIQHLATIAILGPWALDHSAIVLVWNGAVLLENCILFGLPQGKVTARPAGRLLAGALVVALVGLERWGWVDSWPGHALYASHAERALLRWPAADADYLPPSIRRWLGPADEEGFRRLDLTGWSRAERGVPVYPQNRVACGVAEALVERYASSAGPSARLILWGRAGVGRLPQRDRVECINLPSLRRRGDRFWINAHPAARSGG